MPYAYACRDYPGRHDCPATFLTDDKDELWRHIDLHGKVVHGDNPDEMTTGEREQIGALIQTT